MTQMTEKTARQWASWAEDVATTDDHGMDAAGAACAYALLSIAVSLLYVTDTLDSINHRLTGIHDTISFGIDHRRD